MLEITIDNCYKCDLETSNDPNNRREIIEEIQKLKLNATGKLFWISIQTYGLKNIEKN